MSDGDVYNDQGVLMRANKGKNPVKFTPLHLLEGCNRVFEFGARKYQLWGWSEGMDWSIPYECAIRHLSAWYRGEDIDPESGLPHLAHAVCNLMILTHYAESCPHLDDRPREFFHPQEILKRIEEVKYGGSSTATGSATGTGD